MKIILIVYGIFALGVVLDVLSGDGSLILLGAAPAIGIFAYDWVILTKTQIEALHDYYRASHRERKTDET